MTPDAVLPNMNLNPDAALMPTTRRSAFVFFAYSLSRL